MCVALVIVCAVAWLSAFAVSFGLLVWLLNACSWADLRRDVPAGAGLFDAALILIMGAGLLLPFALWRQSHVDAAGDVQRAALYETWCKHTGNPGGLTQAEFELVKGAGLVAGD